MIVWLTCTYGRYKCLQRNLKCYLDQDYEGSSVMYICNTGLSLRLPDNFELPSNKKIYIDNVSADKFISTGQKFSYAVGRVQELFPEATVITHADDDDIFLPNHLSQGMIGMDKAIASNKLAYKPFYSYYRERKDGELITVLANNTLEPSIFVDAKYLFDKKYANVSVRYHQYWLDPLIDQGKILIDEKGKATLIYNWGDNGGENSWNIYKMSGSGNDSYQNYIAHKLYSKDMGMGILIPFESNVDYYKI